MRRVLRDRLRALSDAGFAVDNILIGKHVKVRAIDPHGRPLLIVVSGSPSDWRLQRTFAAQLKRFAREPRP